MPQLDKVTFFSQFFWFSLFYISFYYILYKYFLPKYSRIVLFRDKYTGSSIEDNTNLEEKNNVNKTLNFFTVSAVDFSKDFIGFSKKYTGNWQEICSKKTNEKRENLNNLYLKTFGEKKASSTLWYNSISYNYSKSLVFYNLSKGCLFYSEKFPKKSFQKNFSGSNSSLFSGGSLKNNSDNNNASDPITLEDKSKYPVLKKKISVKDKGKPRTGKVSIKK